MRAIRPALGRPGIGGRWQQLLRRQRGRGESRRQYRPKDVWSLHRKTACSHRNVAPRAAPGPTRAREMDANDHPQVSLDVAGNRRRTGPMGL